MQPCAQIPDHSLAVFIAAGMANTFLACKYGSQACGHLLTPVRPPWRTPQRRLRHKQRAPPPNPFLFFNTHPEPLTPSHAEWPNKSTYRGLLEERGLPVLYPEEVTDWRRIGFAVAWHPPAGLLARVRCWAAARRQRLSFVPAHSQMAESPLSVPSPSPVPLPQGGDVHGRGGRPHPRTGAGEHSAVCAVVNEPRASQPPRQNLVDCFQAVAAQSRPQRRACASPGVQPPSPPPASSHRPASAGARGLAGPPHSGPLHGAAHGDVGGVGGHHLAAQVPRLPRGAARTAVGPRRRGPQQPGQRAGQGRRARLRCGPAEAGAGVRWPCLVL